MRFNAKPLPVPHLVAKRLDDKKLRRIKKEGGLGPIQDVNGNTHKVNQIGPDGRVNTYNMEEKKRRTPRTQYEVEYQDMLERIMEREGSGYHKNVSPTEQKKAKKRLKSWTDGGRPVQGVDD